MDTRYLGSFLRTADLRSISRAAESLGIAQPSLSQQLLRLEDEAGFMLFNRTMRGLRNPTPVVAHASARVEDVPIKNMAGLIAKGRVGSRA